MRQKEIGSIFFEEYNETKRNWINFFSQMVLIFYSPVNAYCNNIFLKFLIKNIDTKIEYKTI